MSSNKKPTGDKKSAWNNFWRDKHGNIVVAQWPNTYALAWVALFACGLIASGRVSEAFQSLSFVVLVIWSYNEITQGVNGFRRTLGVLVLGVAVLSRIF